VTPDLVPPRDESPAAHRHPGLVAFAYGYRALVGILVALPAAAVIGAATTSWPHGQSELFAPGGVLLLESLRLARRGIPAAVYSGGAIAAVALLAGVVPLGALLAGLGRRGRAPLAFLASLAAAHAGTLALLFGLGALAQGIVAAVAVLLGSKVLDLLALASPGDDLAFLALFAVVLALVCVVGVLRDLAAVAAVHGELRFYLAASRALRTARMAAGRALGAWAWRSALGLGGVVVAAGLSPSLASTTTARVLLGVALHQGAILGVTFAHASWLAAAMRLHHATEPEAPEAPEEPAPPAPATAGSESD